MLLRLTACCGQSLQIERLKINRINKEWRIRPTTHCVSNDLTREREQNSWPLDHDDRLNLFGRNGLPVDGGPARKVGKQHDWNDIEILAQGNRVRVAANGVQVVQVINFQNTSDRFYTTSDEVVDGQFASVIISLPPGAAIVVLPGVSACG